MCVRGQGGDRVSAAEDGEVPGAVGRRAMLSTVHLTVMPLTGRVFYRNGKTEIPNSQFLYTILSMCVSKLVEGKG